MAFGFEVVVFFGLLHLENWWLIWLIVNFRMKKTWVVFEELANQSLHVTFFSFQRQGESWFLYPKQFSMPQELEQQLQILALALDEAEISKGDVKEAVVMH